MANVSVVPIPVDDSEFEKFAAAFREYHEKLKDMPADWQAVNTRILELAKIQHQLGASSDKAWSNATNAALQYERAVRSATSAESHLGRGATSAGAAMAKMAAHAKSVEASLFGAVLSLTKFATFGLGGGFLSLGVLAGLDRMSNTVLGAARSAGGMGLSTGQLRAFGIDMRQFGSQSALAQTANAQTNFASFAQWAALGINPVRAANMPATKLYGQELLAARAAYLANATNYQQTAAGRAAAYFGISVPDVRYAATQSRASILAAMAATTRDASQLGFSQKVQQEWINFNVQLAKAGTLIGTALINTLTPLVPQIGKLSVEAARFIVSLEKSDLVKHWIAEFADGLKWLANFFQNDFKKDLRTTATDIATLGRETLNALKWLGLIPSAPTNQQIIKAAQASPMGFMDRIGAEAQIRGQRWMGNYSSANLHRLAAKYGAQYGVDPALINRVMMAESSYGKNDLSPAGAVGPMQLMPATAAAFGVDNPYAASQNVRAGVEYLAWLRAYYGGDMRKAIAAYNWGPGNLNADIKAHGAAWEKFIPKETKRELVVTLGSGASPAGDSDTAKVRRRYWNQKAGTKITITSNIGSQVAVSANAVAH